MSGWPTLRQIVAGNSPEETQDVLQFLGLGLTAFPPAPANGAVSVGQSFQRGGMHVAGATLAGDGTVTQFIVVHSLGIQPLLVRGFSVTLAGTLGSPQELLWTQQPGSSTSAVIIAFPAAPAAGVRFAVAVMG